MSDFSGMVRVSRTPQGLLFQGDFSGKTPAQCVRCLADFLQPLHAGFDELYAFSEKTTSESGLILPEDANVDLQPLVSDYLLLEVPISPLCKPECKGLCVECGADLNVTVCEHVKSKELG